MANLKEIRLRISSVSSTKQITSAMKMVAAAKLRKAQDAIIQMRPYANKLGDILVNLSSSLDDAQDNKYGIQREEKRVLLVVISSNRGLCGGFNANVVKRVVELSETTFSRQAKNNQLDIIAFGKKSADILKHRKFNVVESYPDIYNNLDYNSVAEFGTMLMDKFVDGSYDRIELIYNQFKNAAVQILTNEQYLPVKLNDDEGKASRIDYIFEPGKKEIVEELIPKSLKIKFYKAMLDSNAAEHGARMTAMHQATDNATELIRELKLHYNKARQAAITNEILEIVSGAEALKG